MSRFPISFLALCIVIGSVGVASAQVVQLPSMRSTSFSGTVSVPDAGTGSLGGVRYGRSTGRRSVLGHSYTHSSSALSTSVSVQIIDLKAMDDAILASNTAVKRGGSGVLAADSPAFDGGRNFIGDMRPLPASRMGTKRPAPNAWHRAMAGSRGVQGESHPGLIESKIRDCMRRGKAAESAGRVQASLVYYRMAIEAMTPTMLLRYEQILKERSEMDSKQTADASSVSRKF